jgi:hypothetical protein
VLRAEALDTLPNVVVDDKEDEELIELALVPGVVVTLLFLVGWVTIPFCSWVATCTGFDSSEFPEDCADWDEVVEDCDECTDARVRLAPNTASEEFA